MKSIVICGSSRFAKEAREFASKLKELGAVVYEPHFYRATGGNWSEIKDFDKKFVAMGLVYDHFNKIRLADIVYVYNKDGYSGVSTNIEIGFASALGKPIYAFCDNDEEECRKILFNKIVQTPEELLKLIN
jgi:hypothetical protein